MLTVVGGREERTVHLLRVERTYSTTDWFESVAAADAEDGWGWRGGMVVGGKGCCAHLVGL